MLCGVPQVVCVNALAFVQQGFQGLCSHAFYSCANLLTNETKKVETVSRARLHLNCCDHRGRVMTRLQDIEMDMSTSLITSLEIGIKLTDWWPHF